MACRTRTNLPKFYVCSVTIWIAKEATAFTVSLSSHLLSVAYETGNGHKINESFTTENLYDRAVHMYLRRSKRLERVN